MAKSGGTGIESRPDASTGVFDIAIVGGGYSGAGAAIHLARQSDMPLRIAIVEPARDLGRGLAYRDPETDHRLNGPAAKHAVYPDALSHFQDWYLKSGMDARDPDALDASGSYFARRYDFGSYLDAEAKAHIRRNPSGSDIVHIVDHAGDGIRTSDGFRISLGGGGEIEARVMIVAIMPGRAAVPSAFSEVSPDHPAFIADPWAGARLRAIPPDAKLLILGMSQTASDVAAVLLKYGHRGAITMLSRRGLMPRKRPPDAPVATTAEGVPTSTTVAEFTDPDGTPKPLSQILRRLRRDAAVAAERGESWVPVMDKIKDTIVVAWARSTLDQKMRFFRHARSWYDIHRFRLAPQIERRLEEARARSQLLCVAARVVGVTARDGQIEIALRRRGGGIDEIRTFDAVINCTGLETRLDRSGNPFLQALLARGFFTPHATGLGADVDGNSNAIDRTGQVVPNLFVVGPLTYGAFADQQGSVFIMRRLLAMLPNIIAAARR